ncbi:hypothetical protein Bca4012_011022 [Brassica carinata]|uniref:Uncharacterized protein n=1 Tax=Brassica carinata TaxID=52824 RepID=A0A8X7S491_BRACI|nr:hypothetical protein Bca52824_035915 [Brassica carinata]
MLFHRSSPVAQLLGGLERKTQWRTYGSGHVSTGFSGFMKFGVLNICDDYTGAKIEIDKDLEDAEQKVTEIRKNNNNVCELSMIQEPANYPGDDIPGAGAVTTKLSQGVTREAPETSIGMVERTTTATAVLPPEPVPSGFTAERSQLQEDTLLLFFFSPFCFLAYYEILIQMFTN